MTLIPIEKVVKNASVESEVVAELVDVLPSQPGGTDHTRLDNALVGGLAWTASGKWLSQFITWIITLVVARLLAPSDYGMVGMAVLCLGIVTLFSEFGLGAAVVALRDLSDDQISQLNTVSILLGLVGFSIGVAAADLAGRFFKAPGLPLVVKIMSCAVLVSGFRTVPYSLLQRDMRFRLLALIDGLQSVVQAISTLALALLGFGYWALVLGNLSVGIVSTALTLIWRRQRFGWPRISFLREPLAFSVHLLVGTLGWYTYDNSDFLIAGKVLGSSPLGAYTLAWTLAHAPLDKLTTIVNRVTPSIFSAAQRDFDALRRYLQNISGTLSLVVFPAVLGITLVAKDFVLVALGQKWIGVVLPLELLTLHALFRSNVILLTPLLNVIGEERFAMWNSLLTLAVLLPSFYVGSRWGTGGIAGAWVLIYPFVALPLFWRLFRRIEMPVGEYLGALWPAISACILMATAVELFKYLRSPEWPLYLDLVLEMLIGATVYVLALVLLHRSRLCAILGLIKNLRSQAA